MLVSYKVEFRINTMLIHEEIVTGESEDDAVSIASAIYREKYGKLANYDYAEAQECLCIDDTDYTDNKSRSAR